MIINAILQFNNWIGSIIELGYCLGDLIFEFWHLFFIQMNWFHSNRKVYTSTVTVSPTVTSHFFLSKLMYVFSWALFHLSEMNNESMFFMHFIVKSLFWLNSIKMIAIENMVFGIKSSMGHQRISKNATAAWTYLWYFWLFRQAQYFGTVQFRLKLWIYICYNTRTLFHYLYSVRWWHGWIFPWLQSIKFHGISLLSHVALLSDTLALMKDIDVF